MHHIFPFKLTFWLINTLRNRHNLKFFLSSFNFSSLICALNLILLKNFSEWQKFFEVARTAKSCSQRQKLPNAIASDMLNLGYPSDPGRSIHPGHSSNPRHPSPPSWPGLPGHNTNWKHWSTPTNSAVWPVPYACAQPYHPGSGSHGQLFRPCWGSLAWHSRRANGPGLPRVSKTIYCRGECKHSFKGQLHREQVVAVGWERYELFSHGMRMEMGSKNWSVCPNKLVFDTQGNPGPLTRRLCHADEPQKGQNSCPWLLLPGWYGCAHA